MATLSEFSGKDLSSRPWMELAPSVILQESQCLQSREQNWDAGKQQDAFDFIYLRHETG